MNEKLNVRLVLAILLVAAFVVTIVRGAFFLYESQALIEAAGGGDLTEVKRLVSRGADVNAQDPDFGDTPLGDAAASGCIDVARYLLAHGATADLANNKGLTPFLYASNNAHIDIVKTLDLLVTAGCNVNAKDKEGDTALFQAVDVGNTTTMKYLLKKGVVPTATDIHGKNALDKAYEGSFPKGARILEAAGVKRSALDAE